MKYTEMAQREIYNVVSSYVWQLQNGTRQLAEFDDVELMHCLKNLTNWRLH